MEIKENQSIQLEMNNFRALFNGFNVALNDLKELEGEIRVLDIISPYRIKTLGKTAPLRAKDAKITDFKVIKSKRTDQFFVNCVLSKKALDFIIRYFHGSDRAYRKYKVEFSKKERSLLWKLKNDEPLVSNHKDWSDEEFETFKNPIQYLPTEWDYKMRIKKEKREDFLRRREIRKYRKEFKTLPKVEEDQKPQIKTLQNLEVKQGEVVYNGLGEIKRVEGVIKPPKNPKNSVFVSTEEIKEEKKRALW